MQEKAGEDYTALLLFVAIPIPGTGAWTGILAASILDMEFRKSVFFLYRRSCYCWNNGDK